MELVSCHNHTVYSGHGEGSVLELVQAASAAGISTLAITEHYPLSEAIDPVRDSAMLPEQLPLYLAEIEQARELFPEMEIVTGAEFDWLGAQEDRAMTADAFAPFAYSLLSVHYLDGWGFDDPAKLEQWEEWGTDAVWQRYLDLWCQAATSAWPCTAMAHPDLAKKFGWLPSFDMAPHFDRMVEAAKEGHRMVEVNTSGWYYPCSEAYPCLDLLERFCAAGIPCCIGPDAHSPQYVARGIVEGYALMYEAGYRSVAVPTAQGEIRFLPLDL